MGQARLAARSLAVPAPPPALGRSCSRLATVFIPQRPAEGPEVGVPLRPGQTGVRLCSPSAPGTERALH